MSYTPADINGSITALEFCRKHIGNSIERRVIYPIQILPPRAFRPDTDITLSITNVPIMPNTTTKETAAYIAWELYGPGIVVGPTNIECGAEFNFPDEETLNEQIVLPANQDTDFVLNLVKVFNEDSDNASLVGSIIYPHLVQIEEPARAFIEITQLNEYEYQQTIAENIKKPNTYTVFDNILGCAYNVFLMANCPDY